MEEMKMKKMLSMLLAVMMCFSMSACSNSSTNEGNDTIQVKESVEILNKIWETYKEDEKFSSTGGNLDEAMNEGPGKLSMENTDILQNVLYLPADCTEFVDDAASLIHMMNANTFTGSVFHVKDGNMEKLSSAMKENIMNTQWVCGFPDLLIMANVGDYLVTAFGNEEIITNFKTKLLEVYSSAEILFEENLNQ